MKIKECYVSSNGISCITNINTLINIKKNDIFTTLNKYINKNNIIFYLILRSSELLLLNILKINKFNIKIDYDDAIIKMISFS